MHWRVIKMGSDLFDILHTYGLGIVVASATQQPVTVQEEGCSYRLSSLCNALPQIGPDLLDELLLMPSTEEVLHVLQEQHTRSETPLGVENLDGLLAALFTRPYLERNCSIYALLDRHRLDPSALERTIAGVRDVCTKWKDLTNQECSDESEWLSEMLRDYDAFRPGQPLPGGETGNRHHCGDDFGPISRIRFSSAVQRWQDMPKSEPDHAPSSFCHLAHLCRGYEVLTSATDCRRFHHLFHSGAFIPFACTLKVPALSCGLAITMVLSKLFMLQALEQVTDHSQDEKQWKALSYQVLLSRGKQQAISLSRGVLDLVRFEHLKHRLGEHLLRHWKALLTVSQEESPYELDHLTRGVDHCSHAGVGGPFV